jgi:hypothetical protein
MTQGWHLAYTERDRGVLVMIIKDWFRGEITLIMVKLAIYGTSDFDYFPDVPRALFREEKRSYWKPRFNETYSLCSWRKIGYSRKSFTRNKGSYCLLVLWRIFSCVWEVATKTCVGVMMTEAVLIEGRGDGGVARDPRGETYLSRTQDEGESRGVEEGSHDGPRRFSASSCEGLVLGTLPGATSKYREHGPCAGFCGGRERFSFCFAQAAAAGKGRLGFRFLFFPANLPTARRSTPFSRRYYFPPFADKAILREGSPSKTDTWPRIIARSDFLIYFNSGFLV